MSESVSDWRKYYFADPLTELVRTVSEYLSAFMRHGDVAIGAVVVAHRRRERDVKVEAMDVFRRAALRLENGLGPLSQIDQRESQRFVRLKLTGIGIVAREIDGDLFDPDFPACVPKVRVDERHAASRMMG